MKSNYNMFKSYSKECKNQGKIFRTWWLEMIYVGNLNYDLDCLNTFKETNRKRNETYFNFLARGRIVTRWRSTLLMIWTFRAVGILMIWVVFTLAILMKLLMSKWFIYMKITSLSSTSSSVKMMRHYDGCALITNMDSWITTLK